ncbi:MAG: SRPBCC family protein [Phormidesmis sp.]
MIYNARSPKEGPIHPGHSLGVEPNAPIQTGNQASDIAISADNPYVKISAEKRPNREQRILASVIIPQPIEQVWQVITDYDHLADFVPNLTSSKRLPDAEGRIRLEQIGAQCFLKVKFCARVVLEMTESFPNELGFTMKEGDFKSFSGAWKLQPTGDAQRTHLSYDLLVKPPRAMPAALIERHLCNNLMANLLAIRQRAVELAA